MKRITRTTQIRTATISAIACILLLASAARLSAIDFQKSLDDARKANADGKPIVVQFTAEWCGWCRKMKFDTFADSKVEAIAKDYIWVELDIDDEAELAARFQIESVPYTVVLDNQGRVLGSQGGYFPPDKFVAFLEQSRKNPQPEEIVDDLIARFLKANKPEEQQETIERMVDQLARPSRFGRDEILNAFEQKGLTTWPVLLELMADKRLSIRAAAAAALRRSTKADLPFLPFARAAQRESQVLAWRQWVDSHKAEQGIVP